MRHLVVIVAVICALIDDGWAQNRGSARYVPPEDFDGDITRAPRIVPTRGAAVRRQRPTKAPEATVDDEESNAYQPQESPVRTTARRVPQRVPQTVAHLLSANPAENAASQYAAPAEDPQVPSTDVEGRPQGTRRRRPKKRRRPQTAVSKVTENPDKQTIPIHEEEKTPITELLNDDRKRSERFQNKPVSRSNPSTYISDPSYQPETNSWESNPPSEQHSNAAGSQYYGPQPATNRLPIGDTEPVGNSQGYSSPGATENHAPAPYVPKRPETSISNDASYVPVLSPIRVPSEGASRLPHRGSHPVADPKEIIQSTGAKPLHNAIPQSDGPVRSHSEVRLPEDEQPLLSPEYVLPGFDSNEDLSSAKASEEIKEPQSPSNRLPTPSEIHYDSVYPEYLDDTGSSQRIAGRRQEQEESPVRSSRRSYTPPRRDTGTKPQEYDNDAEIDRRQASQYRPPLLRTGSRYKPEDSEGSTRSTTQGQSPSTSVPRTRGSTRYQSREPEYIPERTRSSTRTRTDTSSDYQKPRSSTAQPTTRTRGSQRYVPETVDSVSRTSPRRQVVNAEEITRDTASVSYVPLSEFIQDEERSSSQSPRSRQPASHLTELQDHGSIRETLRDEHIVMDQGRSPSQQAAHLSGLREDGSIRGTLRHELVRDEERSPPQSPRNRLQASRVTELREHGSIRNTLRDEPVSTDQGRTPSQQAAHLSGLRDHGSVRNTLRSRPQYELSDSSEESVEDSNAYNPDYQSPRQRNSRGRTNPRTVQPPQPEYELPPNRQQNRPEPQYEYSQNAGLRQPQYQEPQNPRSRHQAQYEPPLNSRTDSRQVNNRQNPSSRPQGRTRHQNSEPSPPPRRSSGGSNFKCPDAFGFFADPVQCDKYYECRNGTAEMHLCNDGLAFNEISAPKFLRCDSLRDVDCKSRPELQEAQPSKNCPRKYGLYPHETDCTKFWNCVDGSATEVQCPPGLTYNDERATCDWADLVETSCKTEDLLGFTCPEPTAHDLLDGVYSRYPHPDNCQLHFTCIKGADGLRRPRMLSCNEGLVFDPATSSCKRPEDVPGCEDFYGVRSPPPKRKPARHHEPEPEEIIEDPTPRPRRRGSNRRARN